MIKNSAVAGLISLLDYMGNSLLNKIPFWALPYMAVILTWLSKACLWMGLEREGGCADLATPIHQSHAMFPGKVDRVWERQDPYIWSCGTPVRYSSK